MAGTLPVLRQISILALLMLTGYVGNRLGILKRDAQQCLSKLIINLSCPALILYSVTTSQPLESTVTLIVLFGASVGYFLLMPFVAKALTALARVPAPRKPEYESMLIYSNLGFMGIPVVNAVLGQEGILYISVLMAVFNISLFSYGLLLLQGSSEGTTPRLSRMVNAGTVSSAAAVVMYLLHIPLPSLLLEPLSSLGGTTTPLAMLVIGASLANFSLRELLSEKDMVLFSVLRLLLLPLLCLVACQWVLTDRVLLGVLVLSSGMPVASNVVMLCNELGRDADYIAKGVFFSTVLCMVTISLISMIL